MFDDAEILACYRRSESILPQQALALVNSGLALDLAEQVARRLGNELASSTDESFIESAFQEILGMMPNEEERRLCQKLLVDTMVHLGDRSVSDPKEMDDLIDSLPSHYALTTTAADRMLHLNLLKQLRGDGPNATVLTSWIPSKDASGLHYLRLHAVFRDK